MKSLTCITLFVFFCGALSSCISVKKYNSFIKEKTAATVKENGPHSNDYITITSDALKGEDSVVTSKKTKGSFIPAILYWQWNYTIENQLGNVLPVNIIRPAVFSYAKSAGLKEKLNGKQLEISLEKVPSSFSYTQKGMSLIFIVGYVVQGQEAIYPSDDELVASYRIISDGKETQRGSVKVAAIEEPSVNKNLKSTKKFTQSYIDDYYGSLKGLSKALVNQIMAQI